MFKLVKALDSKENPFYVISENGIPEYYLSLFLKQKGINSIKSAKTYGEKLVYFLNYITQLNKYYWEVDMTDIKGFILFLIHLDEEDNLTVIPSIGFSTVSQYKTSIVSFYRFLSIWSEDSLKIFKGSDTTKELSVHIKTPWNQIEQIIQATLDLHVYKYKVPIKEYKKEYLLEEIKAIYSQFNSIRNKAIFILTLHGMRIDEVLSIQYKDYNPIEQIILPSRSKGKGKGKKRTIVISDEAIKVIENYLLNERTPALTKLRRDSPYLFVNLRSNDLDNELKPLQYQSFYQSLMRAAKNAQVAGVRSHTGRAHRAVELLRVVREGKLGLTDEHFRIIMGWGSMKSADPYIHHENENKSIELAKELEKMKHKLIKKQF